ncbi:hypothetical protein ACLFLC_11040 [Providencia rettgeri]|uniref:hypothetical protein n=1 Tax=Providencia TaxID=586 RepID=UPI001EE7679C|nr:MULTISPECIES: hypothetical protein [Providencia]MCG5371071.1 hypothetical protein [Providencia rettgeri]
MKPLHIRIVEDFKVGHEITTKTIKDVYASTDNHSSNTIKFLYRCGAVKKSGRKDGKYIIYIIAHNSYEKTIKKDIEASKFRKRTYHYTKCDVSELAKTHNPLVLKFNALLAGVRA